MPFTHNHQAKIYWEESGTGEPLLLIMGLGYTHEMWYRTRPVVSQYFRAIVFDNRGAGKSDVPPGPYSMEQMAGDVAAVLDAAGVARADIFGMSLGGMIAQEFALEFPDRVNHLILGCTACGGRNAIPAAQEARDALLGPAKLTSEEGAQGLVPYIYDSSTPRQRVEEDLSIRRKSYPTAAGYMAQVNAITSWTSFERLKEIHAPTLILQGESDQLVPPDNARILARHIEGSKLVMIPHASHIFTTDQPEIANREILVFIT
ncbi:MAG: alpha/beta fold hydrolase [Bryobacteraceae bacterium]